MAETPNTADTASPGPGAAGSDADAAKRRREHVNRLVARPAAASRGSVDSASGRLNYSVSAAFMPVAGAGAADLGADPEAAVLTIAYQVEVPAGAAPRPVCFAFNGGPGSASVWLHLGALGPQRVVVNDDGSMPPPPYAVEANPHTWLQHFDLVFIDPPHTGWSATASDAARKKMLSVDGDVAALAEVVRLWLTRHRRWNSPVYLAGESYGTTRGAALADKLLDLGVALTGLVLVSCAMDLQSLVFDHGNDLPYSLFLPAFACVSQYHGLLEGELAQSPAAARVAAEAFAAEEYPAALQAGARLDARRRTSVARRLAQLTGLPQAVVEQQNLRIDEQTYFLEALRERGQVVGRLEARVVGSMGAKQSRTWEFDPGIEAIVPPYAMASMAYFGQALGLDIESRYLLISPDVGKDWVWQRGTEGSRMGFTSTTPDLARALRRNPHLRVLVASGRYDLGTPYSATDWSLAQLDVTADVRKRIEHRYYDAGHMMYTRQADLQQLALDLGEWLRGPQGAA